MKRQSAWGHGEGKEEVQSFRCSPGLCAGHGELLRKLLRNGSASLKTTVLTRKSPRADHTVPTQWLLLVLTRQQL